METKEPIVLVPLREHCEKSELRVQQLERELEMAHGTIGRYEVELQKLRSQVQYLQKRLVKATSIPTKS